MVLLVYKAFEDPFSVIRPWHFVVILIANAFADVHANSGPDSQSYGLPNSCANSDSNCQPDSDAKCLSDG